MNSDVLPVRPQTLPRIHKRVGYAAASQIRTHEHTHPEEKKNVASPCFIFHRQERLDTRVTRHTSLDFEGGNKSVSAPSTHN